MYMSILKLPLGIAVSSMEKGDIKFIKSHKTFGNFNVKKDLSYIVDDSDEHKLDIYTSPEKSNGITLFYVHGGAYVYGSKNYQSIFASWFVNKGFTVVVPNYRLAQKDGSVSVMDQVLDLLEALKFVEENKVYYGIKTTNLFLMGDSAGGHLCMMLEILLKDKDVQQYYGIKDVPTFDLKGIALNSTMYDFEGVVSLAKSMLFKKGIKWMLSSKYIDDEFVKMNSPRYHYQKGFKPSPLFASTATHDFFNSQTMRLKRDADELGIDLTYLFESSPKKEIGHVYNHFHFEDEEGKKCNEMMEEFFYKYSVVAE